METTVGVQSIAVRPTGTLQTVSTDMLHVPHPSRHFADKGLAADDQPVGPVPDTTVRPQHKSHVRVFYLQHKNLASEILKNETGNSLKEAIARVKTSSTKGDDIYFDEWSINGLGYKLINSERFEEAIEVLKLNTEIFPESANAYDSLAEAYMKSGDKDNAIKFYRRSLELNSENNNAKEMLKTLTDR